LIDNCFHARGRRRKVLRREASRVVGHLAGKSDDAILGGDVDRGRFKERLGIQFGFDAGGDSVVTGLVAGESKEQ
jgi:hypothetical protein